MSVEVVIVAYGSEATIAAAVESVIDDPTVDQVVVVDNLSPDRSADIARSLGATVIHNEVNSGFGAGCNLGARTGCSEWILFLNPDASMRPGSLAGMLEYASTRREVGVVASDVRDTSDRSQVVRRRFPIWWRGFAEPGLAAQWDEWHYRRRTGRDAGPVDWVSASAILVRRKAYEAVGGFDESFFLYAEEIDLCARLRGAGYESHWAPGFPSSHSPGSSTGQLPGMGKEEWARGIGRYIDKHCDRPVLMRASLLIGVWARAIFWAARGEPEIYQKWRVAGRVVLHHSPTKIFSGSAAGSRGDERS